MLSSSTRRVTLSPRPGFVIKTHCAVEGIYKTLFGKPLSQGSDLPASMSSIVVQKGYKLFLNICWDPNVPSPPERTEAEIRRAMTGADLDEGLYYVPVVISDGRPVTDKAGKPSLVFDCVFSDTLHKRTTRDTNFKNFLVEIALERVEDKSGLTLDRNLGYPNILSKGDLEPRTVSIPNTLRSGLTSPLIQEITSSPLKTSLAAKAARPPWVSVIEPQGLRLVIQLPHLTTSVTPILDVEARRLIFKALPLYTLNLGLDDTGDLSPLGGEVDDNTPPVLTVERGVKSLDPDGATAQWVLSSQQMIVSIPWKQ